MVLNATFNNISYIVVVNFFGGGNRKYPEKTTDMPPVTDKLYHIYMLLGVQLSMRGNRTHNFNDDRQNYCTSRCKVVNPTTMRPRRTPIFLQFILI